MEGDEFYRKECVVKLVAIICVLIERIELIISIHFQYNSAGQVRCSASQKVALVSECVGVFFPVGR